MSFQNEVWLAIRTDVPDGNGEGLPGNPYAVNTPESFANIMRDQTKTPANALVRLGPGTFLTRGGGGNGLVNVDSTKLWAPRSGQRLIGSGIFGTTLRFLWDIPATGHPGQRHSIVRNEVEYLSSFELSDLTLDCNLQNAPFDPDPVMEGGAVTASLTSGSPDVSIAGGAAFFDASMIGKIIYFFKDQIPLPPFIFSAKILNIAAGGTQATLDRNALETKSTVSFWVHGPRFTVTALQVRGDNILVRRVRVINFGTRTPIHFDGIAQPPPPSPNRSYEGFPLRIDGRTATTPSFNSVIENCIVEQPYPGPAREVTSIVMGTGIQANAVPPTKLHLQPFGSQIRHCYLNFEFVNPRDGNRLKVTGVTYTAGSAIVTLETEFPHNVKKDDFVLIEGAVVSAYNGRFQVTEPLTDAPGSMILKVNLRSDPGSSTAGPVTIKHSFQPTLRVTQLEQANGVATATTAERHFREQNDYVVITGATPEQYNGTFKVVSAPNDTQFTYNLDPGDNPSSPARGEIWLDRGPNGFVKLSSISVTDAANKTAQLTMHGPHYRKPGEWVVVDRVKTPTSPDVAKVNNSFNNYVQITGVPSRKVLSVQLPGLNETTNPNVSGSTDPGFGTNFQGLGNNGGLGGGYHRNIVANANRGGTYHDFWWEVQSIGRRNYYYNVNAGPITALELTYASGDPKVGSGYRNGTITGINDDIVTVTLDQTGANPDYPAGLALRVSLRGNGNTFVDSEILSAGLDGSNKYVITFRQLTPVFQNPPLTVFVDLWFQQSLFLFEDNILELAIDPNGGTTTPAMGVGFRGPYWSGNPVEGFNNGAHYPWVCQAGIVRDNYIRKVGGVIDTQATNTSAGIAFTSCRNLIVEGNVIAQLNTTLPRQILRYSDCLNAKSFNNQLPSGRLLQLYNDPHWKNNNAGMLDEIASLADDMLWVWKEKPWPF